MILLPMIYLLMHSYFLYLGHFMFYRPRYILTVLYCAAMAIGLPIWLFEDKRIQKVGAAIGILAVVAFTAIRFVNPQYYQTSIFGNSEEHPFDSTSKAYFTDPSFGDVNIQYDEGLEDYLLDVTFKKGGKTTLVIEAADGTTQEYAMDIRIDTYRSSGAGGQHINKTSSAIRITHFPTGIVVTCQNERSQFQNKDKAFQELKIKLFMLKKQQNAEKLDDIRGKVTEIAWGNQIRSYFLQPYQLIKDLRTGEEQTNAQKVLDGDIDPFINAYLRWTALGNTDQTDKPENR